MNDFPLKNWIPYRIINIDGDVLCQWLNTFGAPFTAPFFDETLLKFKYLHNRSAKMRSVSDLKMVAEWALDVESIAPSAFIFHISRCGSSLVSQLLATSSRNIVLSEVPFFDDVLRLPFKLHACNQPAPSKLMAAAVAFYGQKREENERHLFIKTDSWHIFFYEQLRALYPEIPFILLYRKPGEVFRSNARSNGMQGVPGLIEPEVFGFEPGEVVYDDFDGYLALVLEKYLARYLDIAGKDANALLINYNEGPMPIIEKIAAFSNTAFNEDEKSRMFERSLYHSKNESERYYEESDASIPACLNEAIELYHKLEEKRRSINCLA